MSGMTADKERSPKKAPVDPLERVTPMMAQYLEIKAEHRDCLLFYRMGDFYELFFDDAEIAAKVLGIVLTKRGKHLGDDIPMCGVPIDRSEDYLQRLILAGHRVAICEQTEDPAEARKRGPKSVVRRAVARIVTPGTITEEQLLDPGQANLFVAVTMRAERDGAKKFGLAAVDISTGEFSAFDGEISTLPALLARLEPREIVAAPSALDDRWVARVLEECRAALTPLGKSASAGEIAERRLKEFFAVATLDGFGGLSSDQIDAAAAAIAFIEQTQKSARPRLAFPRRRDGVGDVEIDASTRANLELTRTLAGERRGSLIATLDRTVTSAGARLLTGWLAAPLRNVEKICGRHDAVAFLVGNIDLRADLRGRLKSLPDLARALGRLALERGGPRDLAALRDGLFAARACGESLAAANPPALLAKTAEFLAGVDLDLAERLRAALDDDLPLDRKAGGFIRREFDPDLDAIRLLRDESRRVVAGLQSSYAERAEVKQLKIKHNNFLGYFLEVPAAQGEKMLRPPHDALFIHRQTMADAMRFSTPELAELEARISSAAEDVFSREKKLFDGFAGDARSRGAEIEATASALALIDALAGLAEKAVEADWTRPEIDDSLEFSILGGRHPVVDAVLRSRGESFMPNDCDLGGNGKKNAIGGKIAVVTGPNMAGKSTFLRQNALIAILAQMGSFVPAKAARIGVVDRLFSRVGASDDLARGRSTFMVEMVETAAILNQATEKSLVILDEIGRGTATFDGLSIAWATMEHLHEVNRSRALFATHFHELTHLGQRLPRLTNLSMRVADWRGDIVFLHEVARGAADRSYGVQVARLAGLPAAVVARAKEILAELEKSDRHGPVERLVADLPLFADIQSEILAPDIAPDPIVAAVAALDPDEMTPREALDAIFMLKKLLVEN